MHCSAGVGRTGTFLALYKLWLDYRNPKVQLSQRASLCPVKVTELALLPTVLELRKQRCLMVQKACQYVYIARCIRWPKLLFG